jgi:hypothetical protein
MPEGSGTGSGDLFDPWDIGDVRSRVVMPVVNSLIRPNELERVDVGWGPRLPYDKLEWLSNEASVMEEGAEPHDPEDDLWVLVAAAASTFEFQLWTPEFSESDDTLDRIAFRFSDRLEDWVFECVTGRKDLRISHYKIPARTPLPLDFE